MADQPMLNAAETDDSSVVPSGPYNAARHFIDRHLEEGRGTKTAYTDDHGSCTYAELAERVDRAGNMLKRLGVEMEQRVALCMLDGIDLPALFWGAVKIGAVAVPVNTLLKAADYDYILRDSRAPVLVVSPELLGEFQPILAGQPYLKHIVVAGGAPAAPVGALSLEQLMREAESALSPAPTVADDVAFWLYTSGSTGQPKGVVHLHRNLEPTARLYGCNILGMAAEDVIFSAAKLFFAYGLGNAMTFPLHVGASVVLMAGRPTPAAVVGVMQQHQPTIFFGVPTLFAGILASTEGQQAGRFQQLRTCASAGEGLPEALGQRWRQRFGVDILDGIGTTEALHIFISNRSGDVRYGTTGKPVPGYQVKLLDDQGKEVGPEEVGDLWLSGPSLSAGYWNKRALSLRTFIGSWMRTGDRYVQDADGYFRYVGRSDDMLKVSGIWVSPFEVESTLLKHPAVLECAVVGATDSDGLVKAKAFVVVKEGAASGQALADELKSFVKERLAPYKYPRWIEFRSELPKTATGKIQRFRLRS